MNEPTSSIRQSLTHAEWSNFKYHPLKQVLQLLFDVQFKQLGIGILH